VALLMGAGTLAQPVHAAAPVPQDTCSGAFCVTFDLVAYDALAVYTNPKNPIKEISIDELREYADAVMGDSSENSYFEVDAEIARGLPKLVGG